ncbi:hypothetical protein SAY86_003303 [Trapa natans]|uniref:Uncharacterized protein n=1 Tax=Trapa natans TaxID=22666 RepID=A0AAN7MGX5_TRANT|nr:hypothetical protein SAY86_003303 [Trapa natans]
MPGMSLTLSSDMAYCDESNIDLNILLFHLNLSITLKNFKMRREAVAVWELSAREPWLAPPFGSYLHGSSCLRGWGFRDLAVAMGASF